MKCPHCGKPLDRQTVGRAMAEFRDPEKVRAANKRNAQKAGRPRIYPRSMKGRPRLYFSDDGSYILAYRGTKERHSTLPPGVACLGNPYIRRQTIKLIRRVERARKQESKNDAN